MSYPAAGGLSLLLPAATLLLLLWSCDSGPPPSPKFAPYEVAYLRPTKVPALVIEAVCQPGAASCYYIIRIVSPRDHEPYTRSIEEAGLEKVP